MMLNRYDTCSLIVMMRNGQTRTYLLRGHSFCAVNEPNICLGVWRRLLSLRHLVRGMLSWCVGDGSPIFFWYDSWTSTKPLIYVLRRQGMQSSGLSPYATVRDVSCSPPWLGFIIGVPCKIHRHRRACFIRARALINDLFVLVTDSCDRIRWTSAILTSSTSAICGSRRETLDHIFFLVHTPWRFDIS